jgi:superfamily II DNA/RNA helicase
LQVTDYDKYPTLLKILRDNQKILKQNYSIILFVNSIVCSRKTEMFLAENGFETSCLHGEIPPLRRRFEMDKFKKRKSKILVTTDLIARGLDFPFVYLVINFDFPNNISDYIHRAGRTGRAGRKGFVISFFRKFNIDLIDDIKKSNQNKTPLLTEGSMYSKFNKEDFKGEKNQRRKRLTHGILNKSINSRINNPNNGERLSVIQKLKMRKEKIDKMKVKMIKEGKERIKTLDSKYNRKFRNTNKNNTYGKRFVKREK